VSALLRLYWRQFAMALLIGLPLVALMVLGLVELLHSQWAYPGLLAMSLAGVGAALLGRSMHAKDSRQAAVSVAADAAWSPREVQAWDQIEAIAKSAQASPPQNFDQIHTLAEHVVQAVAKQLHADSDFAFARFTVPELLNALQHASGTLRDSVRTRVPGSESITLADVMVIQRFYARHESKVKAALWVRRILRFVAAPQVAVIQELKDYATGMGVNSGWVAAQGWFARLLTEELGRSAINLYAGRYRLTELEAKQSVTQAAPTPTAAVPIRVLLAGQVNAGKSSLTNALLGSIKSPVSELPTPGAIREFRVVSNHGLDLVVIDTPGLTAVGGNKKTLLEACDGVDLILWVTQANNPARAVDVAALTEMRAGFAAKPQNKPPPMALVMTHIDKISPFKEWSPPYDLVAASTPKAKNIQLALAQVAQVLDLGDGPSIPMALQPQQEPYNLDALWAVIAASLNEAQLTALDRELKQGAGFSVGKTLDQCYRGGRFVVGKLWAEHFGGADGRSGL
jgi:predicted GTPase